MTTHNNIVGAQLAARIFGIALVALFLAAPNAALADECGAQILPGTPETITCAPGDYAGGITYSSDGDLTLQVTDDSDHLDVFETGIDVTGNGGDSVSWDSSTFVNNDIRGTGIVLDYGSNTGAIDILIGGDVRAQSDGTHAVRAISSSGNVTVQTNEGSRVFGGDYGIQAETGAAGTLDVLVGDNIDIDDTAGVAAIDATTGTGLLTIDIVSTGTPDASFEGVRGESGTAIRTNAGGDAQIDIGEGRRVGVNAGGTALGLTAAGQTTLNNAGFVAAGASSSVAVQAAGGSLVLNNDNEINGVLDFSGLTDGYTFNNNAGAVWGARFGGGISNLGAGEFNNAGTIETSRGTVISAPGTNFTGSGDSLLDIPNVVLNGESQSDCTSPTVAACLDLTGGTTSGQTSVLITAQKASSADRPLTKVVDQFLNPGIVLVDVSGGTGHAGDFILHPDSEARVDRDPTSFSDDIVVVPLYAEDQTYGAVLRTGGLFDYALLYNPDNQQHVLTSVPRQEGVETLNFVQESLSIWHTTGDTVAGRQADLREDGTRGSWARIVNDNVEHKGASSLTTHGNTFSYDTGYTLDTKALIVGHDVMFGDDYVVGLHGGVISSRADYDASSSRDKSRGATVGVYAGWWNDGGLTLDGMVNLNMVSIDHNTGNLEDTETNAMSYGVRMEAGWRLPVLDERLYVQPLATAAYVKADIEDLDLRYQEATFENTESSRAALGVRLGGGMNLANDRFSHLKYWLTARAWEEYAGDDVQLRYKVSGGDDLVMEDDISQTFEEVGLGASLTNREGNVSVFLSGNLQSGDHTDSENVTIGARIHW